MWHGGCFIIECLGFRSGFIGSAIFWLIGSTKICGSTDPDPMGKNQRKSQFYI